MARIRVLVVEDSITVRRRICEVLDADSEFEVVGEAGDGKLAIERCRQLRPDVITMDMMLPVMTGLAATEYIMAHNPTPILVVSSSFNRGELFRTYEALAAGAVDVLEKPSGTEPEGVWEQRLRSALRMVARIRVITHPRGRLGSMARARPAVTDFARATGTRFDIVALGASTGGPAALVDVLGALPADYPIPIILVLHIGSAFGVAFADWLDGQVNLSVALARDGDAISAMKGRVIVAPPDRHLAVRQGRTCLTDDPERYSCRPSVDVLFESIAAEYGTAAVACLLTGMGHDGASGMLALRRAGALTIAQDEASCVVYGMPREAVLLGGAERVLALADIGPALAAMPEVGRS